MIPPVINVNLYYVLILMCSVPWNQKGHELYRGADKSLARPGRKQANISLRMAWISFGVFPFRKKKTWWQLASRCCWNREHPRQAAELVSFLVGLRTYQHAGILMVWFPNRRSQHMFTSTVLSLEVYRWWVKLAKLSKQCHNPSVPPKCVIKFRKNSDMNYNWGNHRSVTVN